ncbi:MAG: Fic family protein [Cellulomonadaceae bacterium]|jgi:Fic family protein|nr:Fic family protein [Cellulomonadaceae bacterium]
MEQATAVGIPPVGHEERTWEAKPDGMTGRARLAAASGAYLSTVTPPIANLTFSLPVSVAADVEEAAAALAAFDSHARSVLGPTSPILGPMSSILLRTESASSSQIENLTVGARQLALAEIDESTFGNAKTVVGNVRAMEAALALAENLDENAILAMQAALLEHQSGWEPLAGRWRAGLVWVGSNSISPIGASHIAPQANLIPEAMDDLVRFIRRDDLPVIVQAAIAHAQFETIHPFADGNGRTGRAMIHAILRAKKLVTNTTAPVSAGLLTNTGSYFDALTSYRQGNALPIIERFTDASRYAASSGAGLVDNIAEQIEESRQKMAGIRSQSRAWDVLPHLVAQPVLNADYLIHHIGIPRQSAHNALTSLTDVGVLEERTGRKRNRVWQHPGILAVLDDYANHLRRN